MDRRYYLPLAACLLALLFTGCAGRGEERYHRSNYTFKDAFMEADEKLFRERVTEPPQGGFSPRAGTVSHHLLTARYMEGWFSELKEAKPDIKTFFILSPKHTQAGSSSIALSDRSWRSGDGVVKVHKGYSKRIRKELGLEEDHLPFMGEHGIGAFIPYILHYYPDAKIVPVIMDEYNKQIKRSLRAADRIAGIMERDEKSFLLISVDFSHRAGREVTDSRDRISREVLLKLDRKAINSVYSDNNIGLIALFAICEKLALKQTHIYSHIDAEMVSGQPLGDDITSYFFSFISP